MRELWQKVYGGHYKVSNTGKVVRLTKSRSTIKGKVINPWKMNKGYYVVGLYPNGDGTCIQKLVHVLVAETFLGKGPEGCDVDHKDKNRLNNRLSNLRYLTHEDNSRHEGSDNGFAKLDEHKVREILRLYFYTYRGRHGCLRKIANEFGVTPENVSYIVHRKAWKHVKMPKPN